MPFENIPESLRAVPNWVAWRVSTRDGKPTKLPLNARTLKAASSTNPHDWCDFVQALAAARRPGISGIGFVFTKDAGITGIDLDGCIVDGVVTDAAKSLLDRFSGTYAERTPSGKGLHIILRGRKPDGVTKCKAEAVHGCKQIEIYDTARFFTFTGDRWGDAGDVIDCQTALGELCRDLWTSGPSPREQDGPLLPSATLPAAAEMQMRLTRCIAYLKPCPDAVSGQGGHEKTLRAACDAYRFGLDDAGCMEVLRWFNANKCPAGDKWTEKELIHKMEAARAKSGPGMPEFGEKLTEKRANVRAEGKVPAASDDIIPYGSRDPADSRLVLSSKQTLPTAKAHIEEFHTHTVATGERKRGIVSYVDQIYEWRGNHYREVRDATMKARLQPWLHEAKTYWRNPGTGEMELRRFDSNDSTIKMALHSIHAHCELPESFTPPTWLDDTGNDFPTSELLICRSKTIHIPTRQIIPPTPQLFATSALEFDYDDKSPAPQRWIHFLNTLWPNDADSINLLQDWFGYLLTQDTRQQKMLFIKGPRRSGKGTIARILTALIGKQNMVGSTIAALSTQFGLQPLIGKSLLVIPDARFSSDNIDTITEKLLILSGEDSVSIDRKFKAPVTLRLPTRITLLSNDVPKLNDASSALAGRLLILILEKSYFGQEDFELESDLLKELPGILLWAIEGWERLRRRGRFVQPASVKGVIEELEDLSSPVGAFVRECCIVGDGHRCFCDDLYAAWRSWCDREGRTVKTTKQTFGRDLSSAFASIHRRRSSANAAFYEGISIKSY